jgi:hypothetical protein
MTSASQAMTSETGDLKCCPLPRGCGQTKRIEQFSVNRVRRDGHCTYCAECTKQKAQAYRDRKRKVIAEHCAAREARRQEQITRQPTPAFGYPWQRIGLAVVSARSR